MSPPHRSWSRLARSLCSRSRCGYIPAMVVHRRGTRIVIGVLCALMLAACTGSSGEQASDPGAAAGTLTGKRTVWGPVSLILPTGFAPINAPGVAGTGDNYSATDDPVTYRTLLAVSVIDIGNVKATFNAKTQSKDIVQTARIIATGG